MNKYQEAYNTIYEIMAYYQGRKSNIVSIRLFKELVDKATPKKVVRTTYNECPNCSEHFTDANDYCQYCGQALDWREDE